MSNFLFGKRTLIFVISLYFLHYKRRMEAIRKTIEIRGANNNLRINKTYALM